jgi:Raf kinase inhibitor-like YbhB/YbcL family protein
MGLTLREAPAYNGGSEIVPEDDPPRRGDRSMSLTIRSAAFAEGHAIPRRHTEDGEDLSPPLSWSAPPPGTVELALIVDDPDAPRDEPWVHWVIYKIPAKADGLPEGIPQKPEPGKPPGAVQGKNTWGTVGYRGPAPPKGHGVHHYHFKLYALNAALDQKPGFDKHDLMNVMSGHILSHGELVGTYQR